MPLTIWLRKGKKALQEKVPISLNDALGFYQKRIYNLQYKGDLVRLQVQTAHFGIGASTKQTGKFFRNKTA